MGRPGCGVAVTLTITGWLTGCWGTPAPDATPEAAWMPSADPDVAVRFADPDGVPLDVQFVGMGALYRSYFSDPRLLAPLSRALSACVDGTATLSLSYVTSRRDGRVALTVPKPALRCGGAIEGGGLDVTGLVPLSQALATYRNGLGATKDMRIYAFRTALHVEDTRGAATLWLEGQDPIDGTAFSPCVGLDGWRRCMPVPQTALSEGHTVFRFADERLQSRLASVLGAGASSPGTEKATTP